MVIRMVSAEKKCACCGGAGFTYLGRTRLWDLYGCMSCSTVKIVYMGKVRVR